MRRYNLYIFRIILGCILFSACTDEIEKKQDIDIVEGIPTKVSLHFSTPTPVKVETKALTEEDEIKVNTLRVFVFDKDKQLEVNQLFSTTGNAGSVSFNVYSGIKYIYAIANEPGEGSYLRFAEEIDLSRTDLTIDQIKRMSVQLKSNTVSRVSANLVMTGTFVSSESNLDEGFCNIKENGSVGEGKIALNLLDTRINFTIQPGNSQVDFVPLTYRVYNVPLKSNLFSLENDVYENEYYSQSEGRNFDELVNDNTGKCSFYMLENRKYANETPSRYPDREKEVKDGNGENEWFDQSYNIGKYRFAPDYSTFVEFTGYYTGEKDGKKVMANVRYVVHLGEAHKSDYKTWNNYATERNSIYNYTVKIYGVDDIRVEVESSHNGEPEEPNPGAEGEIVETTGYYQMDCHNGMILLIFDKEKVEDGTAGFTIKTPFEQGYYYVGESPIANAQPAEKANDYQWVKFARNKKKKRKGGAVVYVTDLYRPYSETNVSSYEEGKLMTIVELLKELKGLSNENPYDSDGRAVYTAYVMENYYYNKRWSEFTNKSNRELHILCNTQLSNDAQSSLTTSAIMISQRSIKSFYADGAQTAWGVETDNETGEINWDPSYSNLWSKGNTADDGRSNFYLQLQEKKYIDTKSGWKKIMSYQVPSEGQNQTLVTGQDKMQYACLQRNIDENRDGKISLDEIKWYPAAINQLTDMWIGKDALPMEAQLYRPESKAVKRYLSSTKDAILFAEEGSSISSYDAAMSYQDPVLTQTYQVDYRCVRNLGFKEVEEESLENKPVDYVSYSGGRFTLQNISSACLRDASDNSSPLGRHDENSDINRPYSSGFTIMPSTDSSWDSLSNRKIWNLIPGNSSIEGNPCPKGWRIPNQRELALIVRELRNGTSITGWASWLGDYQDYVFSCTSSSLPGKKDCGYALYRNSNESFIITIPEGFVGYVRCVKDN